jgi:raffinose/stachyose/melibiose transport system substrate-binding protein
VVNKTLDDQTVDAAKRFLDYMAMSERGQKFIVEDAKYIPAFTNIETEKMDPLAKSILSYSADGRTIPWVWHAFPSGMNENDAKQAFQDYVLGNKDWTEVLTFLDAKWDEKTQ